MGRATRRSNAREHVVQSKFAVCYWSRLMICVYVCFFACPSCNPKSYSLGGGQGVAVPHLRCVLSSCGIHLGQKPSRLRSAKVRAYDDRAWGWNIGLPYNRAYALSSYALTYVALSIELDSETCLRSGGVPLRGIFSCYCFLVCPEQGIHSPILELPWRGIFHVRVLLSFQQPPCQKSTTLLVVKLHGLHSIWNM